VETFTPGAAAGGAAGPARRAGAPQREELFHAQLARRLAELEVRGAPVAAGLGALGGSVYFPPGAPLAHGCQAVGWEPAAPGGAQGPRRARGWQAQGVGQQRAPSISLAHGCCAVG